MKSKITLLAVTAAVSTTGAELNPAADGQGNDVNAVVSATGAELVAPAPERSRNRLSLSYRAGVNIKASFSNLGGFAAQSDPGPATGGGLDRRYDDGYNLRDGSGNQGGLTWNWGYDRAAQVAADDTVVMNSSVSPATAEASGNEANSQNGLELAYNRQLGHLGRLPWGVELAMNYTDVRISNRQMVYAPVTRTQDAYALGGILPPVAPFDGSLGGPGPLISDSPTRSVVTVPDGASVSGRRDLDADVLGWRLGPYLDVPLTSWLGLSFSAGVSLAFINSEFTLEETVTILHAGSQSHYADGRDDDLLIGGYVGGQMRLLLSDRFDVCFGAEYQNVGTFSQELGGRKAELDLSETVFVFAGLGWVF